MFFLSDIQRERKTQLDFQKKSIGFEEEKKELKVRKKRALKLSKIQKKKITIKEDILNLKLHPQKIQTQKIIDLHLPRKQNLIKIYRSCQVSPQHQSIQKEIWRFGIIGFAVVFLINLAGAYSSGLLLKKDLEAKAFGAYESLMDAGNSANEKNFLAMFADFKNANQLMQEAENVFLQDLQFHNSIGIKSPLQNINLILKSGLHLTKAGQYLTKTIYNVQTLPDLFLPKTNEQINAESPKLKLTDKIKADSGYLNLALTELENAQIYLDEIETQYLPIEIESKFEKIKTSVIEAKAIITLIQSYIPIALNLLGDRYPQSYMVLLQNNHEARATGGFIGSYILLDLNDGEITKFELKDVYEADGQFHEKVTPPDGLHKITENWRMRDANYSPDFATSAKQIMWFLEHEKGPTVDTVIAINQKLVEDLLTKIDPILLPGTEIEINSENFNWIFSYLIEAKLAESNSPKQFLMDFAPVFKAEILKSENLFNVLKAFEKAMQEKDILAYSSNAETNKLIQDLKIDGRIMPTDQSFDYLQVTNTSIGGNKSDGFIRQKIQHQSEIDAEGKIKDSVIITRKHTWYHNEDEIFEKLYQQFGSGKLKKQELKDILGFGGNKNLMRVYVPLGSELISATGSVSIAEVNVYEDLGKTVFAFEQPVVYTERESEIELSYLLPHRLTPKYADNYKFILQNQPGQEENYLEKTIQLNPDLKILQQYPQSVFKENIQKASFNKFLKGDEYLSVVIGETK